MRNTSLRTRIGKTAVLAGLVLGLLGAAGTLTQDARADTFQGCATKALLPFGDQMTCVYTGYQSSGSTLIHWTQANFFTRSAAVVGWQYSGAKVIWQYQRSDGSWRQYACYLYDASNAVGTCPTY